MRLHRLIAILLLLESRGCIKSKDLAGALETSKRTIHRDIELLCEAGIPIKSNAGPNGGFSLMDGYTLNIKELHCDEVITLYLCGLGLHPNEYSEASLKLKNAILKLEKTVPAKYLDDIKIAKDRFFFDPKSWWKEKPDLRFLDVLRQALWQSKKLNLTYHNASMGNNDDNIRVVHPYGMVVKNGEWYLAAFCENRQDIRVFKCDRIIQASMIDDVFCIPSEFNLESFWNEWVEKFKNMVAFTPQYLVKLRLLTIPIDYLEGFEIIEQSSGLKNSLVTVNLFSYENACKKIIQWNNNIEVLAPDELRDFAIKNAKNLLGVYIKS